MDSPLMLRLPNGDLVMPLIRAVQANIAPNTDVVKNSKSVAGVVMDTSARMDIIATPRPPCVLKISTHQILDALLLTQERYPTVIATVQHIAILEHVLLEELVPAPVQQTVLKILT